MSFLKDDSIYRLIADLDLERRGWIVQDHWDGDLFAVGIALQSTPRRLVYVSTFDRRQGRFDYDCEAPSGPDPEDFVVVASGVDVDYAQLLAVLLQHLSGANPGSPGPGA